MDRVARGDRAASAELFELHRDAVYRYARGMGLQQAAAEDVTQEVFLTALSRAGSYRGTGPLAGWLVRIARTAALDRLRSASARRNRERSWAVDQRVSVDAVSVSSEGDTAVSRAFRALPLGDREVIVLSKFLEFPSDRVARILDISPGTARVRLHRALRRLADRLSEVETR